VFKRGSGLLFIAHWATPVTGNGVCAPLREFCDFRGIGGGIAIDESSERSPADILGRGNSIAFFNEAMSLVGDSSCVCMRVLGE